MERIPSTPRPNWQEAVEARGLKWHTGSTPYWSEDAYYRFTTDEIDAIERATNELHERCLEAVQHVIDERRYAELTIPEHAVPLIEHAWNNEPPSIYGRFDLAYDGASPPVMLEYNADTPTALLEAAVIQWDWLEAMHSGADQFNSLHERLVALWREMIPHLRPSGPLGPLVHFASMDDIEDGMTSAYLAETAVQAGLRAHLLAVSDVGWDADARELVDMSNVRIDSLFKLYPWEWLIHEPFAANVDASKTVFIEPAWKMILSNKGILAILWDLFPGHPNLLPAYLNEPRGMFEYVKKPLLSREGANVTVHTMKEHLESTGEYGAEGYVFQQLAPIPAFDGKRPVLGSWIIGQEAGGMGVREAEGWVTGNTSRFVPHLFR
ncbi:MAG TPA: glutathionylspermidine synthase family protein [Gemmatimonadaceae bacterium]|jgi:glutathionylspermidine synthase|nr:glutathionylspermidine synthase family protein [Gemmatimonadaceae bacterium]